MEERSNDRSGVHIDRPLRVWAVVVTRNRRTIVTETVQAVKDQVLPPERIVVVDNASTDGTPEALTSEHPDVVLVRNTDNSGYAAAINDGVERVPPGVDAVWILDDDSPPHPGALSCLEQVLQAQPRATIVGSTGYRLRFGTPRPISMEAPGPCDATRVDNALVRLDALRHAGGLRGDFFMMWEDMELSARLRRLGGSVFAVPDEVAEHRHLGSSGAGNHDWRAYYHSRNQLRDALDRPSVLAAAAAVWRHLKIGVGSLVLPGQNHRWRKAGLRWFGLWDAVRNRMGRVALPRWAGPHP